MANIKISELDQLTNVNVADSDIVEIVDVSDTTAAPTGTNKRFNIKSFVEYILSTFTVAWGGITGTLSDQTDLQDALNLKADQTSLDTTNTNLSDHEADGTNPHTVTADQVGLGNVDNTSDANKPISDATQTALDLKADIPAKFKEITASNYTLIEADLGYNLEFTNPCIVTLPGTLSTGFQCILVNNSGVDVQIQSNGTYQAEGNALETQYTSCVVVHKGSDVWGAYGKLTTV